jgi:hypothetical protein
MVDGNIIMYGESGRMWEEAVAAYLKHLPERSEKNDENPQSGQLVPGQDLNQVPPKCKSDVLLRC